MAITADVLNKDSLLAAKEQILKHFGRIDFLINDAGGNHPDAITEKEYYEENSTGLSFFDLQENGFSDVFSLNFTGTFLACQVFGEVLLQAENPAIIGNYCSGDYSFACFKESGFANTSLIEKI